MYEIQDYDQGTKERGCQIRTSSMYQGFKIIIPPLFGGSAVSHIQHDSIQMSNTKFFYKQMGFTSATSRILSREIRKSDTRILGIGKILKYIISVRRTKGASTPVELDPTVEVIEIQAFINPTVESVNRLFQRPTTNLFPTF
ncbi:hypothetical protein EV426DRAFT_570634 [Tirmania nivea]|nr:hypothetical protein EV426DRAFT_570634 [Tirmania nivea]